MRPLLTLPVQQHACTVLLLGGGLRLPGGVSLLRASAAHELRKFASQPAAAVEQEEGGEAVEQQQADGDLNLMQGEALFLHPAPQINPLAGLRTICMNGSLHKARNDHLTSHALHVCANISCALTCGSAARDARVPSHK